MSKRILASQRRRMRRAGKKRRAQSLQGCRTPTRRSPPQRTSGLDRSQLTPPRDDSDQCWLSSFLTIGGLETVGLFPLSVSTFSFCIKFSLFPYKTIEPWPWRPREVEKLRFGPSSRRGQTEDRKGEEPAQGDAAKPGLTRSWSEVADAVRSLLVLPTFLASPLMQISLSTLSQKYVRARFSLCFLLALLNFSSLLTLSFFSSRNEFQKLKFL